MTEQPLSLEQLLMREVRLLPAEYLPNLVQMVRLFRETVMLQPAEDSFRVGWQEARQGETQDIAELWDGLDGE